jgi:hypothetical protein
MTLLQKELSYFGTFYILKTRDPNQGIAAFYMSLEQFEMTQKSL